MGIGLSFFQFANDTLIMCSGSHEEVKVMRNLLIWYVACSGLKVHTSKSVLYQINSVDEWDSVLSLWNYGQGVLLGVCLGLPLGAKHRCVSI